MADSDAIRIKGAITLTGDRAFFVPAGFTWRNIMNEAIEKRAANDVYDDLTLNLGHIAALLDVMANCDKDQCDVDKAAYGLEYMVEDAKGLAEELCHAA